MINTLNNWRKILQVRSWDTHQNFERLVPPEVGDTVKVIAGPSMLMMIGLGSKPFKELGVVIDIDEHTGKGWIMVKFPKEGKANFPLNIWDKYLKVMYAE